MDAQLYIYTRTKNVDYGVHVSPTAEFCTTEVKKFFRDQVRGVLNADQYTPDFTRPRWLLSRVGDITLWGVACWNETHGNQFITDEAGRSHLRSFTGIVCKGTVGTLPYDMGYFSRLFNDNMAPLWEMSRMDPKSRTGIVPDEYAGDNVIKAGVAPGLNMMTGKCLTQEEGNVEKLFGTALVSKGDVSMVTNLLDLQLAFDDKYQFMNAHVVGAQGHQVHKFASPSKIPQPKGNAISSFPERKIIAGKPDDEASLGPVGGNSGGVFVVKHPGPEEKSKVEGQRSKEEGDRLKKLEAELEAEKNRSRLLRIMAIVELLLLIVLLVAYCGKGSTKENDEDKDDNRRNTEIVDHKKNKDNEIRNVANQIRENRTHRGDDEEDEEDDDD